MNIEYSKDFEKSVKKLSGKMLDSVRGVISEVKNAESIKDITDCKKLVGYRNVYHIRIGDYRAFFTFHVEIINDTVIFRYLVSRGEAYAKKMADLKEQYRKEISEAITLEQHTRNVNLAKEIYLSVGRYDVVSRNKMIRKLLKCCREAMRQGLDMDSDEVRNDVFSAVTFRVKLENEAENRLFGRCVLDLANIKYSKDLTQIRGKKIATVFQDPMTSLNPIITIGQQITSIILKHQHCSEAEARIRAMELMKKVGIPNAENRFDDYPFQYSGGMRQRIVIAIALSCRPKILICDEPTTALDVTIQAQILKLIKDLQKEFHYTIVFITHDLGVVANIADRVAVLYAGQIVELGTVEDVFYDPRHPYTWAMLSSLPQLA